MNHTPFFLNYGRHPWKGEIQTSKGTNPTAEDFVHALEITREEAAAAMTQAAEKAKSHLLKYRPNPKPKEPSVDANNDWVSKPATSYKKELLAWQEKEDLAMYLLMQKLPDSIFAKYMRKEMVAEIWVAIIEEFTHKSMLMQTNLHSKFMSMRYEKGEDLRTQFDKVRMKYEALLNVGIPVSTNDY
jgi:hypothetical protein